MKLIAIHITNNETAYGGEQSLCQVVLFVQHGNPYRVQRANLLYKIVRKYETKE